MSVGEEAGQQAESRWHKNAVGITVVDGQHLAVCAFDYFGENWKKVNSTFVLKMRFSIYFFFFKNCVLPRNLKFH